MWLVVVNKFSKTYAKEILFVLSKKLILYRGTIKHF